MSNKVFMSMSYNKHENYIVIKAHHNMCLNTYYAEKIYPCHLVYFDNTDKLKDISDMIVDWYQNDFAKTEILCCLDIRRLWKMAIEIAYDFIFKNLSIESQIMWDITDPDNIIRIEEPCDICHNCSFCNDEEFDTEDHPMMYVNSFDNKFFWANEKEIIELRSKIKALEYLTDNLGNWIERLEDEVFIENQDDSRITRLEKELFPNEELSLYSQVKWVKSQLHQMTETYENQDKHIAKLDNETFIQNRIIDNQSKRITKLEEEIEKLNKIIKILANQVQITILG